MGGMSTQHERSATLPKAKPEGRGPWMARVTVDRIVHLVAGIFILVSLALAKFHHPNWIWFTVFVGANLLQSGLTNWCLMATILHKLGVHEGNAVGCSR
jgi:hypothetical protein